MIRFTIIIPVYNVEKYLKECLDSITTQGFKNFEVICVNDDSTDNSLEILKDHAKTDSRFIVISQENQGPGVARNNAMEIAKGEYTLFVDPDDFIAPNMLETINNKIEYSKAQIIHFNRVAYNETYNKKRIRHFHLKAKRAFKYKLKPNSFYIWKNFKSNNRLIELPFASWDKAYNTDYLKENNITFAPHKHGEDHIFSIKSLLLAKNIYYIDDAFYYYRYREDSLTNNASDENLCIFERLEMINNFLIESELFDEYASDYTLYKLSTLYKAFGSITLKSQQKYIEMCQNILTPDNYKIFLEKINGDFTFWEKIFCVKNKKVLGNKKKVIMFLGHQIVLR